LDFSIIENLHIRISIETGESCKLPGIIQIMIIKPKHFIPKWPFLALLSLLISCSPKPLNLTQYVDPLIGTGDHGHVFIGANVPYGMVQLGPTEFSEGWDWCSGYHYSDSTIIGFAHTHLSGAGSADMGDISLMPAVGEVKLTRGNLNDPESGLWSKFSHANETAQAGYYKVHLDRFNIDAELTSTVRVGFHRYTFPASGESKVIIDLEHGIDDLPTETYVVQEDDSTISGYRTSTGWAQNHTQYFTARFSKPMISFQASEAGVVIKEDTLVLKNAYGVAHFKTAEREIILVKVALSPVSIENAKMNLNAELPGWDFDKTREDADKAWNKALNKIKITSDDLRILRTFYTAFYHTMVAPSVYCDVNGD